MPLVDVVGLLVSCLLVVVAFSPVLFFGHTLSMSSETAGTNGNERSPGQPANVDTGDFRIDAGASSWALEPWAVVTNRAYSAGELPLWNPYASAGAPHAANMQSAAFDPLLLAVNLHPTQRTWDLSIIGAFVLGAAAAYLFARVLGMWALAAVVTSAAFSLSGWFFLYSNNGWSRSYAYLPLLFLLVELTLRTRRLVPVFALGVVVAGNIYVGMPEASVVIIGSAAVYAIARLVQERRRVPLGISLLRLGGAGLLGVMLAAPLLLLFLQYEPLSFNIHKSGSGTGAQTDPQWGLLNWLVPFFQEKTRSMTVRNWIGVAVGISALVGMCGRAETKRLHGWLFAALAAAVLLKIYEFRVFDWVGRLPVVERIVFPTFGAPVASFALAVLAGIGVNVLWRRDLELKRFVGVLATAAMLLAIFVPTGDRWSVITSATREHLAAVWGRGAVFAALAVAAVLVGWWLGQRFGAVLLAAVVVAELFVLAPTDIYPKRGDPYVPPAWTQYVRTAFGKEPDARVFGLDGTLYPNTAGALGLQDIRGLDALYVERYLRYVRTFVAPHASDRFTGTELPVVFRNNPMLDALAVRAILSQHALAPGPGLRLVGRNSHMRVYENSNAYPRAWVVHDVHLSTDEDGAFRYLQQRSHRRDGAYIVDRFDPRNEAVVEAGGTHIEPTLQALEGGRTSCASAAGNEVTVERYSAESVELLVNAGCQGLLVLPDVYFPGWTATVNGEGRPIYATDGAFRGVTVPKGASRVELHYAPRAFPIGIAVACCGLIAFLAVGGLSLWRRRSRNRSKGRGRRPCRGPRPRVVAR